MFNKRTLGARFCIVKFPSMASLCTIQLSYRKVKVFVQVFMQHVVFIITICRSHCHNQSQILHAKMFFRIQLCGVLYSGNEHDDDDEVIQRLKVVRRLSSCFSHTAQWPIHNNEVLKSRYSNQGHHPTEVA